MGRNDIGIIDKPLPNIRVKLRKIQSLGFKIFHEQVRNYRGEWITHGKSPTLLIEFILEDEKGRGR